MNAFEAQTSTLEIRSTFFALSFAAMKRCKYWVLGRGCYSGTKCRFYHDPELREQNFCHKFNRGTCGFGDLCARIHEKPSTSGEQVASNTVPIAPEQRKEVVVSCLKTALRDQLNHDVDDKNMDDTARKRKFLCFYEAKLHPDKWTGWPEMEQVMSEICKDLNSKRTRYEAGFAI